MNLNALKEWFSSIGTTQPKRDWSDRLPPWTSQYSVPNRFDAWDCLSESLGNIVYMVTGFDSSPRALAKISNTTPQGNYQSVVLKAANEFGLIPYPMWPTPDVFEWNDPSNPIPDFYADIPQHVLDSLVKVKIKMIPPDLNKSPLWTILRFPNGAQHGVAQINEREYFDSELGAEVKSLNYGGAIIVSQYSLNIQLINYKPMTIGYKKQNEDTVYVAVGTVLVPIADWNAFVRLGGSQTGIINLPADEFAKFTIGDRTLFKSS